MTFTRLHQKSLSASVVLAGLVLLFGTRFEFNEHLSECRQSYSKLGYVQLPCGASDGSTPFYRHITFSHKHSHPSNSSQPVEHEHTHTIHVQPVQTPMINPHGIAVFSVPARVHDSFVPIQMVRGPRHVYLSNVFRPPIGA